MKQARQGTRREFYRPIIARIIEAHGGVETPALRQALREAFPHPPRTHHPYQIWLDEIRQQLRALREPQTTAPVKRHEPLPGQLSLFET